MPTSETHRLGRRQQSPRLNFVGRCLPWSRKCHYHRKKGDYAECALSGVGYSDCSRVRHCAAGYSECSRVRHCAAGYSDRCRARHFFVWCSDRCRARHGGRAQSVARCVLQARVPSPAVTSILHKLGLALVLREACWGLPKALISNLVDAVLVTA